MKCGGVEHRESDGQLIQTFVRAARKCRTMSSSKFFDLFGVPLGVRDVVEPPHEVVKNLRVLIYQLICQSRMKRLEMTT